MITFLYFGTRFLYCTSEKTPESDIIQMDNSFCRVFTSFVTFDTSLVGSQTQKHFHCSKYGESSVFYFIYNEKINFSDTSIDFFEENATISVENDFSLCTMDSMHHSYFLAAYRTNRDISTWLSNFTTIFDYQILPQSY